MARGRYPADRRQSLMQVAAAAASSAAAAQVVHSETADPHDLTRTLPVPQIHAVDPHWVSRPFDEADHSNHFTCGDHPERCRCTCRGDQTRRYCPEHGEQAYGYDPRERVIDAAREYFRTGGDSGAHHELLDAVAQLERAERNP